MNKRPRLHNIDAFQLNQSEETITIKNEKKKRVEVLFPQLQQNGSISKPLVSRFSVFSLPVASLRRFQECNK